MAWVRVDDKMALGPKVKRAAAKLGGKFPRRRVLAVWLQAMSYCNLNLTDGFVPDFEVADIEDERPADVFTAMAFSDSTLGAIVERDETRGGWVFRNYHEYQPSKASVEEKAEIDRKRKAEYRASKIRPRVSQGSPNGTEQDGANVSAPTGPTRTDPTRSEPSPKEKTPRKRVERPALLGFDEFWHAYPLKRGKNAAIKAWNKLQADVPLRDRIAAALEWQAPTLVFERDGEICGTHPATWLNGARWLDERSAAPVGQSKPTHTPLQVQYLARQLGPRSWASECMSLHGGRCGDPETHDSRMAVAS